MLEDTTVACPTCDKELHVKIFNSGKKSTYIVNEDCPNCKEKSGKIEKILNRGRGAKIRIERSYIKVDPRG